MKEREMETVALFINRVVTNIANEAEYGRVRNDIQHLCESFPLYSALRQP
jgi:glycine/serine hydroxymethyltransferase